MKRITIFSLFALILTSSTLSQSPDQVPVNRYLEFARRSADWTWKNMDSLLMRWKETLDPKSVFGYRPPPRILEMATIYATLYEMEKKDEYAERARKVLLTYGNYRKEYPEEAAELRPDYSSGVPALPDFFTTMRYIRPYEILKKHNYLNDEEQGKIEEIIEHSMEYLLQTQEWGPMNRTALRAEALAWAIRAMPDHPNTRKWKTMEEALGFDNWGNWEIEDATIYHAIWLYAMMGYADAKGKTTELFGTPEMYYYAQYFLQLISPDGMIPDFGDANWQANWNRFLVFFEAAATVYKNPEMKWAASVIAGKFIDFEQIRNTGLAYLLLDCYRYGTDEVIPQEPAGLSTEVMEDVQGKKIVFRNGWSPESTFMLLNYRDEGDGGVLFRDYLRDVIPVEEEKMTHGHADENSIVLLMNKGSVLLHDGGYRDYMPSGPYGAYRQDYFHNRLCVRQEKIWMGQEEGEWRYSPTDHPEIPGQSVLDFLHNAGSYRIIRTQKIDFLTFTDFDYSRTRLIDDKLGYEWDRIIAYVKNPEMFVIFDVFKSRIEEFFTAANLWHTREIIAQGNHWYDTRYDSIGNQKLNTNTNLLIHFPRSHFRLEQVERETRYYQTEWVLSETTGQHFELGQHIGFVTILVPHPKKINPVSVVENIRFIESDPEGKGLSVEIRDHDRTIQVGIKQDLRMDMVRDYRRPKYTYESGKIRYGKIETNGDFFYTQKQGANLNYTVVNLTRATYDGKLLFDQKPGYFGLAFDGSSDVSGVGKARYWRDEVKIE
ncbi:MAG: hypothetical protein JSV24_12240 [Bacteroidales bacterium]|nr:MAG: hypothetical protein JSV24_12240 [Bacteroidales bacterium]